MNRYKDNGPHAPRSIEAKPSYSSYGVPENYEIVQARHSPDLGAAGPSQAAALPLSTPSSMHDSYHKYVVERHLYKTTTICSVSPLEESEVLRLVDLAPNSDLFTSVIHRTDEVIPTTTITSSEVRSPLPVSLQSQEYSEDSARTASTGQPSVYATNSRHRVAYLENRRDRIHFYNKDEPYYGFTNFSPHPVVYQGKVYPTSEHLFQSFKFIPDRPLIAEHIRLCSDSPRNAYSEAQGLKHLIRQDWVTVRIELMEEAVWQKFSQHSDLREELLSTGDAELFEDSPVDSFWGGGSDRQGRNELGKALMRIRTRFRAIRK